MKISTEIDAIANHIGLGEEKAIELVAKAGFDAWDCSLFEMGNPDWANKRIKETEHPLFKNPIPFVRKLKKIGLDNGIVCNQSHAPFPSNFPGIRDLLKLAIECTAEAGGQYCIIHPDNNASPEENAEMFFELLPTAKACGVKIATENMWNYDHEKKRVVAAACSSPKSFLDHINAVGDEYLVACLDIGHAEMQGCETSAVEMIHALKGHLQALHIHDNDKIDDSHEIPFSMKIDFHPIVKALKEEGYNGYFTMESPKFLYPVAKENAFEAIKRLADAARSLADEFESL